MPSVKLSQTNHMVVGRKGDGSVRECQLRGVNVSIAAIVEVRGRKGAGKRRVDAFEFAIAALM